jgi:single stranded DNA-binding protein
MQENFFILAGYLGTKPEVRYLSSGTPVANARLAQSMKFEKEGQICEHTNWFNLVFYGDKLVEVALSYEKGDNIHVTGMLEPRQWETSEGAKRDVYEVAVRRCHRIADFAADNQASELAAEVTELAEDMKVNRHGNLLDNNDDWVI